MSDGPETLPFVRIPDIEPPPDPAHVAAELAKYVAASPPWRAVRRGPGGITLRFVCKDEPQAVLDVVRKLL